MDEKKMKRKSEFPKLLVSSYFFGRRLKSVTHGLIFLSILFMAYCLGFVEIDSRKIVFKFLPTPPENTYKPKRMPYPHLMENSPNHDASLSDQNKYEGERRIDLDDFIDIQKPNIANNVLKAPVLQNNVQPVRTNNEKNISNFFLAIEQNKLQITDILKSYEANTIAELIKINTQRANANKPPKKITRDRLVNMIRYEKFRLNKTNSTRVASLRDLLEKMVDSDEVSRIKELPAIWNKYYLKITERQLYNETDVLNDVLKSMATSPVSTCEEKEGGTQVKLSFLLEDGTNVLVKPMRNERNYETPPDHYYFSDHERHHAEIAAFHVDRVLGFYRVPPTVGRVFNMTTDIYQKAGSSLTNTFFFSPVNNTCFTGHCTYYCDTNHATCGKPGDRLEGSVQLLIPKEPLVKWHTTRHPYRRSYNKKKLAEWETNERYCEEVVFPQDLYQSKVLLDLMDLAVFDFITGNLDRHHYERILSLSNKTCFIHIDNGRSFGKQYFDDMSILSPVRQCCVFRYSTFVRLKELYMKGFSKVLDESLKIDPLYPILTQDHLKAVDRRLEKIFLEVNKCIDKFSPTQVVIDDGY